MHWKLLPLSEFNSYFSEWDQLNTNGPKTPLLDTDFVVPLLKEFATGLEKLAVCEEQQRILAIAIVTRVKTGVWMTFQPSQSPLGLWIQDPSISLETLMQSLRKTLPFPCLQFSVTQQDPDLLPRPINTRRLKTLDYIETARVTIDRPFDDYWSNRGKNLRQNLKRQRNRLNREEVQFELKCLTQPEEIVAAICTYGEIETAGWKNESGTAIHADNAQGKFYRNMMERFCTKQQGIVFQYLYHNQVVATDLCIHDDQTLIILKTTYDETITTSSPAMLMRQDAFAYIFEKPLVKQIEFYGKVMDWHTKWTQETRTMYHLNYRII